MKTKTFKVIAVSSNTNSFGYKSIILVAADGTAWEILKQAYSTDTLPKSGDLIKIQTSKDGTLQPSIDLAFTSPRKLYTIPPGGLKEIFTEEELKALKPVWVTPKQADYRAPGASAFDVFEVRTVATYAGNGESFCEVLYEDYDPADKEILSVCWSVYGHYKQGTVRCISDCDSFEAACELAVELGGRIDPIVEIPKYEDEELRIQLDVSLTVRRDITPEEVLKLVQEGAARAFPDHHNTVNSLRFAEEGQIYIEDEIQWTSV
jgi:hypothetical protein